MLIVDAMFTRSMEMELLESIDFVVDNGGPIDDNLNVRS